MEAQLILETVAEYCDPHVIINFIEKHQINQLSSLKNKMILKTKLFGKMSGISSSGDFSQGFVFSLIQPLKMEKPK